MSNERVELLRQMVQDDPEDAFSRYALAIQLKGLDRIDEALSEMATLVERTPDYVPTYYHYGAMLHASGESEQALGIIRRGIEVAEAAGDQHAKSELEDLLDEVDA